MTKIYLIRHGESEWNLLNKVQGQTNTHLTQLGEIQAKAIGNRLINKDIDAIYTSDLTRAHDTAKFIGREINKPIISSKFLREINFGHWEGLTIPEIRQDYGEEYDIWLKSPDKMNVYGVENLEILSERVIAGVNFILEENLGKNIAIVSHSVTLKVLLLGLLGIPLSHYKNFSISNVGLSIVECRDYNRVLTKLNDISHLEGLL